MTVPCPSCRGKGVWYTGSIGLDVTCPACSGSGMDPHGGGHTVSVGSAPESVEPEPEDQARIWLTAWWPVVSAIVATGADCTVLDPDASEDEVYHDGHPDHGVVSVRTHCGLGWTIVVSETESDQAEDADG